MMDVIEQLDHMPLDINFEIRRKHILDAEAREEAVNPCELAHAQELASCLNSCLTPSQTLIFVCRVCCQHLAHKSVEPHSMRSSTLTAKFRKVKCTCSPHISYNQAGLVHLFRDMVEQLDWTGLFLHAPLQCFVHASCSRRSFDNVQDLVSHSLMACSPSAGQWAVCWSPRQRM